MTWTRLSIVARRSRSRGHTNRFVRPMSAAPKRSAPGGHRSAEAGALHLESGCVARSRVPHAAVSRGVGRAVSPSRVTDGLPENEVVRQRKLSRARERGFPVTIYRPGAIVAHSRRPGSRASDLWFAVLQSAVHARELPDVDRLDFAPVDAVARAVVAIALTNRSGADLQHRSSEPTERPDGAAAGVTRRHRPRAAVDEEMA